MLLWLPGPHYPVSMKLCSANVSWLSDSSDTIYVGNTTGMSYIYLLWPDQSMRWSLGEDVPLYILICDIVLIQPSHLTSANLCTACCIMPEGRGRSAITTNAEVLRSRSKWLVSQCIEMQKFLRQQGMAPWSRVSSESSMFQWAWNCALQMFYILIFSQQLPKVILGDTTGMS